MPMKTFYLKMMRFIKRGPNYSTFRDQDICLHQNLEVFELSLAADLARFF